MGRSAWIAVGVVVLASATWIVAGRPALRPSDSAGPPPTRVAAPAAGAALAEVALPGSLSPDAEIGRQVFDSLCASCHGANAAGRNGAGPPLVHRTYGPSHHADIAFAMAVRNGVRAHHWDFGDMPPVEARLTDGEIGYLVRYVRELQSANGIE